MEKNFTKIIICHRINKILRHLTAITDIKWVSFSTKDNLTNLDFEIHSIYSFKDKFLSLYKSGYWRTVIDSKFLSMDDKNICGTFVSQCWQGVVGVNFLKETKKITRRGCLTYTFMDPFIQIKQLNCSEEGHLVRINLCPKRDVNYIAACMLNMIEQNKETENFCEMIDDAMVSYGKRFVLIACIMNYLASTNVIIKDVVPLILGLVFFVQI